MAATKSLVSDEVVLRLVRAEDGSVQVGGTYTAQRVIDIPELGERVRQPFTADLAALYSQLSAKDRTAAQQALDAFLRAISTQARARA